MHTRKPRFGTFHSAGFMLLIFCAVIATGCNKQTTDQPSSIPLDAALPTPKNQPTKAAVVTIDLTESGFSPQTVTIKQGDVVKFTTNRTQSFWPASDLHPTHLIYSEFDPQVPIRPDQSWSFQFDKVGPWKFHDHLSPNYRGVIAVIP